MGLSACRAVFAKRRRDIIKVYLTEDRLSDVSDMLKWCAAEKKAYRIVSDAELGKITQSTHHEGICLVSRPLRYMSVHDFFEAAAAAPSPVCIVCLDRVENPHNFGAIVRVAAHFGVLAILQCGSSAQVPALSGAVYRTAEGGLESVPVIRAVEPEETLTRLKDMGYSLIATSSHQKHSLYRTNIGKRVVLLLGSEGSGLDPRLSAIADSSVAIPGTGNVESLNVACATSTILGEFWRRMHE